MRCQLCFRLVEPSAFEITSDMFSAELRFYQRVYVVKNMICNVANERLWFLSSQEDIDRRKNSRSQFRFLLSSEETRSHRAVFHDCHRENPECKLNYF